MKSLFIVLLYMLFNNVLLGQDQALKISNQKNNKKEVFIKENKRVVIKTVEGRKIKGRMQLKGNSIIINKEQLALADIKEIRKNPLLVSFITSGALIYLGSVTVGIAVIAGFFADSAAFFMIIPGAAMIYAGAKSPVLTRRFSKDKDWDFEFSTSL